MAAAESSMLKSGPFGGDGGSSWDDMASPPSSPVVGVQSITIRHGNQVDGIQVVYRLADNSHYEGAKHGGYGGSGSTIVFAENETLVRVEGKTNGVVVDQLTFTTQKVDGTRRRYGPYGRTGLNPFSVDGHVVGFFGRSGNMVDGIGVYTVRTWPTARGIASGRQ